MKSILATLVLSLVSSYAMAETYDVRTCVVNGSLTMSVNLKSKGPEIEAKYWNNRSGKWFIAYLSTQYSYAKGNASVYAVEALEASPVAYLQVGGGVKLLNAQGVEIMECKTTSYGETDGDYGGMRGDEFIP